MDKEQVMTGVERDRVEQVFQRVNSQPTGLTAAEAAKRLAEDGPNKIADEQKRPLWQVFLANFTHLMAILLWVAGIIAIVADLPELGIAVFLVNVINGVFSFLQEYRAGKATDALKNMLPSYARVIRDGEQSQVLAEELVVGDVILLEEGDKISADARLIQSHDLQVNQSVLTGESNPVRKQAEPVTETDLTRAETPNLIFASTAVSEGTGRAVVLATGMATEFGKIAGLTQNMADAPSPLQRNLNRLTKQISIIAFSIGLAFFLGAYFLVGEPMAPSFVFALGMIVAFIPEGLLPTVTLSLARAVQRMSKRNALVKKLNSVEALGSTTVICTDKTGTLTQNEMTVIRLRLPKGEYQVDGVGYSDQGAVLAQGEAVTASSDPDLARLLSAATLASNAKLLPPDEETGRYTVLGDPTEACLGVVARKAGINTDQLLNEQPRLHELPFESRRKRMTTIHVATATDTGGSQIAYTKGAPKEMIERCAYYLDDGQVHAMTPDVLQAMMDANDGYAREGLRVLAVAYRMLTPGENVPTAMSEYTPDVIETDLILLGLMVMQDPPRAEVPAAVQECREAGIRIIMITGDYGLTAESIARHIGIVQGPHPRIISGPELEQLPDETLKTYLQDEIIFARVAPEQKLRVVTALQELGEVVAVTGDGVNDSPALKKADIGVAMGMTGTDVAKDAADMILTDDNFASIVHAIKEGRTVYDNIQKFLVYILTSNMGEAVPSIFYLFSGGAIPLPLTVMQILLIDLGTDLLPALGLGVEPAEEGIMQRPPRKQSDPLLNRSMILKAFFSYGLASAVFAMLAYFFVNWEQGWPQIALAGEGTLIYVKATTMTLLGIIFSQVGNAYNCRTNQESIIKRGLFSNPDINKGVLVEIGVCLAIMYVPFLRTIFHATPIDLWDWAYLGLIPVLLIVGEEFRKAGLRRRHGSR